jgi:60 kDa SS-A/Ro ribonucleoprotein
VVGRGGGAGGGERSFPMTVGMNRTRTPLRTHEGAPAKHVSDEAALRRSVLACLLWEDQFYEDGQAIAQRIDRLADRVPAEMLAGLAVEARSDFHLRHAPLLLLNALVRRGGPGVADAIAATIQRPDEMAELLAIYWKDGRRPLAKQLQKGLAQAFGKFDEYQLAKYDREGAIRLRDVLFLSHAKPDGPEQEALFARVAERRLKTPDTWETGLSAGADKRETFERLIREGRLGYLALLRNLRGMLAAGVDPDLVAQVIVARQGAGRVLPFRYVAAARACPQMEPFLDQALIEAVAAGPRLPGKTIVLVDVSGSMTAGLSRRSDLSRMDAAAALAAVIGGDRRVFTFSNEMVEVPPRAGMAGVDAIRRSQRYGGTRLGAAVTQVNALPHDRLIVVTDEQSQDRVPDPIARRAYMINVASHRNGVGYGRWTHIDGFSEAVLRYIAEVERDR